MTKKELIKAIKSCKQVIVYCAGMTEHDGFDVKAVKSDLLWTLKHVDTSNWVADWWRAQIDKNGDLYIG